MLIWDNQCICLVHCHNKKYNLLNHCSFYDFAKRVCLYVISILWHSFPYLWLDENICSTVVTVMLLSNTLQFVSDLHSQTLLGQGTVPNFPACSSVYLHLLHPFGCAQQKVRDELLFVLFYCLQPAFLELCHLLLLMFKTVSYNLKHLLWRLCFWGTWFLHHCKHNMWK